MNLKLASTFLLLSAPLWGASEMPKALGTFGAWKAYEMGKGKEKTCYMVGVPEKSEGKYSKRGSVYAMITHRPGLQSFDVFSFHAGYPFGDGQEVLLHLSGKEKKDVTLFTQQDVAWGRTLEDDKTIATYLTRKCDKLIVDGKSAKGTPTKDIFSLAGSMKAYQAICKACGVKG